MLRKTLCTEKVFTLPVPCPAQQKSTAVQDPVRVAV